MVVNPYGGGTNADGPAIVFTRLCQAVRTQTCLFKRPGLHVNTSTVDTDRA